MGTRSNGDSSVKNESVPLTDERRVPSNNPSSSPDPVAAFSNRFALTRRERQVFASLVAGRSQKETAAALGIAESTVRFHAIGSYSKCGVRNQREMLALFARSLHRLEEPREREPVEGCDPTFGQLVRESA